MARDREPRVFVIDDDPAALHSLTLLLRTEGLRVVAFSSATAFLAAARPGQGGCVVSDVRMPDIDGVELLRRLRGAGGAMPVILITGHGDVPLAVQAMKAGAAEFIEKPFESEHILRLVRHWLERDQTSNGGWEEDDVVRHRLATLTARERQVLDRVVAGDSNKLIARDLGISPRTVEIYRANVMAKMQAANLTELVRLALGAGPGRPTVA